MIAEKSRFEAMRENLAALRRRFKLSQNEFIKNFLVNENGETLFSIAKLSMLENKGGHDLEDICKIISQQLSMDPKTFELDSQNFSKKLEEYISKFQNSNNRDLKKLLTQADQNSQLETLARVISDYITDSIINGDLKPGYKIPSDRNLAVMFQTSRSLIREALKVLSVLGLIEINPGKGTFIASKSSELLLAPITWAFYLSDKSIDDVLYIRYLLELASAKLAAVNATKSDMENLEKVFDMANLAYQKSDLTSFLNLDIEFHITIAKCSHNDIILHLLTTIRKLVMAISRKAMINIEQVKSIYTEHDAVFFAILSRNPAEAEKNMGLHLSNLSMRYNKNLLMN